MDSDLQTLQLLLDENTVLIPITQNGEDFKQTIPLELHGLNGIEWDPPRVVADILRAFGLTRTQRRAFVSYKRSESRAVAVQLFDELSHRGYQVFLDTFSVPSAEPFQEVLWGEMANVDLLVFLETKSGLTSKWVYEELALANDLGLGVLQLLWPGETRTPGTEFSELFKLKNNQFQNGSANVTDRLRDTTIKKVLAEAERARIRSLKSRRDRVVTDLVEQARAKNFKVVVHPAGDIEIRRAKKKVATAIPLVGVPDAATIELYERKSKTSPGGSCQIVYDSLGVRASCLDHLKWLNCDHRLNTRQLTDLDDWLGGL